MMEKSWTTMGTMFEAYGIAKEEGIIEGTSWLTYKSNIYKQDDGIIKLQGLEKFINFMRGNRQLVLEMRQKVISKIEKVFTFILTLL